MNITLKTKFNIGDSIYTFRNKYEWWNGQLQLVKYVNNNNYIITSIEVQILKDKQEIYYRCTSKRILEDEAFATINECKTKLNEMKMK